MKPILIDRDTASSIIAEKDEYINNFSEFDLQSRLGTSDTVTKKKLLEFLTHQTLDWQHTEIAKIKKIFEELTYVYKPYKNLMLDEISLIKTTGKEECDAAYTRKNCIYLPISMVRWPYDDLKELIAHELFHIISTNNSEFRNKWYAKLGFNACPKLEVPIEFKDLYVTNPDTVGKNCFVEFQENGIKKKAVPFLYSKKPYRGGYFFRYFVFSFLVTDVKNDKCFPIYEEKSLKFIDVPQKLYNLCEEIEPYENQHRLHPEEILAYYWSFLPFSQSDLGELKCTFFLKIHEILNSRTSNKEH